MWDKRSLVPGLQPWHAMPGGSSLRRRSREAGASRAVCSEAGASEQVYWNIDEKTRRANSLPLA